MLKSETEKINENGDSGDTSDKFAKKEKLIINEMLNYNIKKELGVIDIDNNILQCKKVLKTIKSQKRVSANTNTDNAESIVKLQTEYNDLYKERLNIMFNANKFDVDFIKSRYEYYNGVINEYVSIKNEKGEKNYTMYSKQTGFKRDSTEDKKIMSKEEYFNRMIGNHEKSIPEKKTNYNLFVKYENLKKLNAQDLSKYVVANDNEIKSIIDLETDNKLNYIKILIKPSTKVMDVIYTHMKSIIERYNNDLNALFSSIETEKPEPDPQTDTTEVKEKNKTINNFLQLKNIKSTSTNMYKSLVTLSSMYSLLIDVSKEEKNVEINFIDYNYDKQVKGFVEKNTTLKYLNDKYTILQHIGKEFKQYNVDVKLKNLIAYLIMSELYNDISTIIKLTKHVEVPYKKKVTTQDEKTNEKVISYVDVFKSVTIQFTKIHPNVIENIWSK